MAKSKVESSMSEVKVDSSMRVELSMVESKVKVESSMVGMQFSNFHQKTNIESKTEKRKSSRLTNKVPDEKRRLIG